MLSLTRGAGRIGRVDRWARARRRRRAHRQRGGPGAVGRRVETAVGEAAGAVGAWVVGGIQERSPSLRRTLRSSAIRSRGGNGGGGEEGEVRDVGKPVAIARQR